MMLRRLSWMVLAVASVSSLIAARGYASKAPIAPEWIAADTTELRPPLAKGDRLPFFFSDRAPPQIAVEPVAITPVELVKGDEAKDEIVGWPWHEGAKVIRRRRTP
jgi:hypothetical protein